MMAERFSGYLVPLRPESGSSIVTRLMNSIIKYYFRVSDFQASPSKLSSIRILIFGGASPFFGRQSAKVRAKGKIEGEMTKTEQKKTIALKWNDGFISSEADRQLSIRDCGSITGNSFRISCSCILFLKVNVSDSQTVFVWYLEITVLYYNIDSLLNFLVLSGDTHESLSSHRQFHLSNF